MGDTAVKVPHIHREEESVLFQPQRSEKRDEMEGVAQITRSALDDRRQKVFDKRSARSRDTGDIGDDWASWWHFLVGPRVFVHLWEEIETSRLEIVRWKKGTVFLVGEELCLVMMLQQGSEAQFSVAVDVLIRPSVTRGVAKLSLGFSCILCSWHDDPFTSFIGRMYRDGRVVFESLQLSGIGGTEVGSWVARFAVAQDRVGGGCNPLVAEIEGLISSCGG